MMAFRENTSLKQLIGTNTIRNSQIFLTPTKTKTAVNVPHVTPVDRSTANKFSKQHLQALKPERPFFTKSLVIVTMPSTY